MAEDTLGVKAAGEWYAAAKPTYTTLVDTTHLVTELYNLVNVPSGIWVDEEGRVLRINEGAYTGFRQIGSSTKDYLPLVRDWVANGAKSPYIWSSQEMTKRIRKHTSDEALADPTFKLIPASGRKNQFADAGAAIMADSSRTVARVVFFIALSCEFDPCWDHPPQGTARHHAEPHTEENAREVARVRCGTALRGVHN